MLGYCDGNLILDLKGKKVEGLYQKGLLEDKELRRPWLKLGSEVTVLKIFMTPQEIKFL
ncbi:MAG: hypothetical protein ACI97P_002057 [Arcticibacterium sp.]|jgi:hypothetical protein